MKNPVLDKLVSLGTIVGYDYENIDEEEEQKLKEYGIAYSSNGSPPPSGAIVSWHPTIWNNLSDALEGCENDGWRGYVCEYPSGYRPEKGWIGVGMKLCKVPPDDDTGIMNIQDVVKNFMGKKITKEGNSKFWGTDDLHEHCLEELKRMNTDEKIQFLIERGVIDDDLGGDPVNPFGEP